MKQVILLSVLLSAFFAFDAAAQLRPAQGQYYQEFSAFKNPSFEQGLAGWELTGDCVHTYTGSVPYLNKALQITCANGSFELKQNITSMTGLAGQIAGISLQGVASASGVTVSSLANDVTLSSQSIPVGANYNRVTLPSFALDGTSNGVKVSASSFTGQVLIDMAQFTLSPHTVIQSADQTHYVGGVTFPAGANTNCRYLPLTGTSVPSISGCPGVGVAEGDVSFTTNNTTTAFNLKVKEGVRYRIDVSDFLYKGGSTDGVTCRSYIHVEGEQALIGKLYAGFSGIAQDVSARYYDFTATTTGTIPVEYRVYTSHDSQCEFMTRIEGWRMSVYAYPTSKTIVQQESQDRTSFKDFIPVLQAGGTNLTFDYARWKKDGEDIIIEFGGSYTGSNSDPTLSIRLPDNEFFKNGKIRQTAGYAEFFDGSVNHHYPIGTDARNDGTSGYFQILKSGNDPDLPTIATGDKISGYLRGTVEGWEASKYMIGTFTAANMDNTMKRICQTKSLTGNVTATGDISEWTFTNLPLGREFTVKGTPICYGDNTNENTKSCDLRVMNGSAGQVGRAMMLSTGTYERHSMPLRAEFIATDTTVTVEAYTMNNAYLNSAAGVGTRDVTLCMEPKTNVSTTQW